MDNLTTVGAPFKIKYVSDVTKMPLEEAVGTILVTSDGRIFKGNGASKPLLALNDILSVATEDDLESLDTKQQGKLYFTKDTSTLWTWDSIEFSKVSGGVEPYDLTLGSRDILVPEATLFGKPIYAAVINTGTLPTDVEKSKSVPHGIDAIECLYRIEGFASDNTATEHNKLIFNSTPTTFMGDNAVAVTADTANIYVTVSIDHSRFTESTVILYYTKTTDDVVI